MFVSFNRVLHSLKKTGTNNICLFYDDYRANLFWTSLFVGDTDSLRSCEYSKNNKLFDNKIHYISMILYLNYMNKKLFFSIQEDQKYSDPKA